MIGMLCIVLLILWISAIIAIIFGHPYSEFFFGDHNFLSMGLYGLGFILLSVPLLTTGFALWSLVNTRSLGTVRLKRKLGWIWVTALIVFVSLLSFFFRDFSTSSQNSTTTNLENLPEIIDLNFQKYNSENEIFKMDSGEFVLAGDKFIGKNVDCEFYPTSESPNVQKIQYARGNNSDLAENRAASFAYEFESLDEQWTIPQYFEIDRGQQWRAQKVQLNFHLPIGQKVRVNKSQRYYLKNVSFNDCVNQANHYLFEMTSNGLKCLPAN